MKSGKLRFTLGILVYLIIALAPLFLAERNSAQGPSSEDFTAKAMTLELSDFLKAPASLDATKFTVAKTPPRIDFCIFPGLKDRGKGTLWSSWGDGCVTKNGKYYTSIGDHLGKDATSYVYEYDPITMVLKRVVDVLQAIAQALGLFGHGKIHAGIHEAADGTLYFATYWGKPKEIDAAFTKGFEGSILLRFDPKTGKTENLGAIVPRQGLPASFLDGKRQLLYFHSVYKGDIAVFDLKSRKVKFLGGGEESALSRTFMSDARGRVYFSATDGTLHYYDPETNALANSKARLPEAGTNKKGEKGNALRAAVNRPTRAGIVYGMTSAGRMFAFDPAKESVRDLGPNFQEGDYTAVMVMSPDEKFLYFAPGAHGSASKTAAPVVQYNIATGERKVLVFLQAPLQERFKYNIGGTYNLQIDGKGETLFITFNGAAQGARGTFGLPSVIALHIPAAER